MDIVIKRIDKSLPLPVQEKNAAGFDFFCREPVTIQPKEIKLVRTNTVLKLPKGYMLLIANRSSTPLRKGLVVANGVGISDPFYCGEKDEILVQFLNITDKPVEITKGEKLAQGIIVRYEIPTWKEVDSTGESGVGGYWVAKNANPNTD